MRYQGKARMVVIVLTNCLLAWGAAAEGTGQGSKKAASPAPRKITVKCYASYRPLFAQHAKTLDPMEIVRGAWKGWMSKRGIPWGMLPGGQPTLRLSHDCMALLPPTILQHSADGPDNNMRCVGAHALLHEMLGKEKKNDPLEAGHIGYLLSCTDPDSGIPYCPDTRVRNCYVGHGEFIKNVILMYENTGLEWYKTWAAKAIAALRYYAVVEVRPHVGPVAWYPIGDFSPGQPRATKSVDPTLDGWQHLDVGWNLWAFSKWHELTGEKEAMEFAVALANRLCNSADPNGNDGSFRPDGSFGGDSPGSNHMHAHTHCLPGMLHLGGQLIKTGQKIMGLELIQQASRVFDWLYDPARNPEAGSMTGWLVEKLNVDTGCEGCAMGDIVQTAAALGASSRLEPSLAGFVNYYDRAEQIFRGQLEEQIFRLRPSYLAVLKQWMQKRVDKAMPDASPETRAQEAQKRYQQARETAERMVGQQLGLCSFPDWAAPSSYQGVPPIDLGREVPAINMQGCCADATIRAAHAIWSETVTGDAQETRVNLAFNRTSPLVNVISCLPHRGEVNVIAKAAQKVLVRVPEWAPKEGVKVYVNQKTVPTEWQGPYVRFDKVTSGQQLTLTYPLRIVEVTESIKHVEYTERWRGDTIVDITPSGRWIPMFLRPELDTEKLP